MNTGKSKFSKGWSEGDNLRELFEHGLRDIYWVEKNLTKAIPKMIKNSSSQQLVDALQNHLSQTEEQVGRVEQVFDRLNVKAQAQKCDAMEGIIKEGNSMMDEFEEGWVRDAAIIAAAQKVEHYEISAYGTLIAFARTLGFEDVVQVLQRSLEEEKQADKILTDLAVSTVNVEAVHQHPES